jgi:hypothetical protein
MSAATGTPSSGDFSKYLDFRTISAFFFGWVFYLSFSMLFTFLWPKLLGLLAVGKSRKELAGAKNSIDKLSVDTMNTYPPSSGDSLSRTLIIMLLISFMTGSLANFGSLLTFNKDREICAFSVAWGILAVETARLMGVFVLLLTLRHLGMKRWELIVSLVWLFIGLSFVFINTALATGTTEFNEALGIWLCYRKHNLPSSVVSTSMYFVLEVYVVVRLWFRLPRVHEIRSKWTYVFDIRMLRAFSLVLLSLLTAVPSAKNTNTLVESVPYSIGAIAVLLAFNHEANDWELTNKQDSPDMSPSSPPASASTRRDIRHSIPTFSAWVPHHPFSAQSLGDPSILPTWDEDRRQAGRATARSTKTIDSPTARSIRDAVVQQARREFLTPTAEGPPRSVFQTVETEPSNGQTQTTALKTGKRSSRPVLPRLVIVTRTDDWPDRVSTRLDAAQDGRSGLPGGSPTNKSPPSHFSSPSFTQSRSTVTYPDRVLSFSSTHHDSVVSSVKNDGEPLSPQTRRDLAVDTRIVTNPDLLGPPPASPVGPRIPGTTRWR